MKRNTRRETNTKQPPPAALTNAVIPRPATSILIERIRSERFSVPAPGCNHPRSFVFQSWVCFLFAKAILKYYTNMKIIVKIMSYRILYVLKNDLCGPKQGTLYFYFQPMTLLPM